MAEGIVNGIGDIVVTTTGNVAKILVESSGLGKYLEKEDTLSPAVVVMGYTGAGKSSLLNSLFETSFETGSGRPVTTAGLHRQYVDVGGKTLRVFDSCGFETRMENESDRHNLLEEVKRRCESDALTVLYCINAAGSRVNDTDMGMLEELEKYGSHVVIALTKADQTSEEDTEAMRQVILAGGIKADIVDVCSVVEGESNQFGVEKVMEAIINEKGNKDGSFICNMAVLGKTGVGKSSMLNYLVGTTFEAGAGKPVTGEGLFEEEAELNGQKVRVFDSWGIEPDKLPRWKALLEIEKGKHGATLSASEWFHAVVYCVQAVGDRVEDIDTAIIVEFMNDGYRVVVALTKCVKGNSARQDEMIRSIEEVVAQKLGNNGEAIVKERLAVVPVCSVEKKLRNGVVTSPFGKEELAKAILDGWRETVMCRLPEGVVARLKKNVDEWVDSQIKDLAYKDISGNIDSKKNSGIVRRFYLSLDDYVTTLFKTQYNNTVLQIVEEARTVEEGLARAMRLRYNSVYESGLTRFRDAVSSNVTAGTWVGRISSFGIAAIVGRFSSRAKQNVRQKLQAQFQEGRREAHYKIDGQLPQIKADIEHLLRA